MTHLFRPGEYPDADLCGHCGNRPDSKGHRLPMEVVMSDFIRKHPYTTAYVVLMAILLMLALAL